MALFDVGELLNAAVKDEETGIAFYKALAEATQRPDVKAQCIAISKQEQVHAERFRKMLDAVGEYKPSEEYPGQYENYLKALLENRAFPEPEKAAERARAAVGDAEAIDIAMRLEKDTLVFLREMKSLVPGTHGDMVDEVIREEQNHLTELAGLKRSLA